MGHEKRSELFFHDNIKFFRGNIKFWYFPINLLFKLHLFDEFYNFLEFLKIMCYIKRCIRLHVSMQRKDKLAGYTKNQICGNKTEKPRENNNTIKINRETFERCFRILRFGCYRKDWNLWSFETYNIEGKQVSTYYTSSKRQNHFH